MTRDVIIGDMNEIDNFEFEKILAHKGHKIEVVTYGDKTGDHSVSIECENCHEVLYSVEHEDA